VIAQGDNPDTQAVETSYIDWTDVLGRLAKSDTDTEDEDPGDTVDNWIIDLAVPTFSGFAAQDWLDFVREESGNPDMTQEEADAFSQPIENEHKVFGCDLWIEVTEVSEDGEEPVFDVTVTRDDEETIGDTNFTPDMDDNQLVISTKEHYGVHVAHTGPGMTDVNWKITIVGPAGFDPVTEVDLQEEGFEDTLNGPTIAVEDYVFDAGGVAEGSVFDLDPNDVFENVDSLHFLTGAPLGQYTITRTLVDSTDNPVSNTLNIVVDLVDGGAVDLIGADLAAYVAPTGGDRL
jgi:hypothetical protein